MNSKIKNNILFMFMLLAGFIFSANAQEVKNIRVSQEGNWVNILYDLSGKGQSFKVDLFYSVDDGKNWEGPLKGVTGDVGENVKPGKNKQITWDVLAEPQIEEGYMQFMVIAETAETSEPIKAKTEVSKPDISFRKYKTGKTISLTLGIASLGTGIYTYLQGNKLYDEYQSATEDAADLHSKVEMYDMIYPVAFIVAGASTVSFIICSAKQGKAKKKLSFLPIPLHNGGGLAVSFQF
jgi:hypothetical protein